MQTILALADSLTAGPVRAGVHKLQDDATDLTGAFMASYDAFGNPDASPGWGKILGKAGVPEGKTKAVLELAAGFMEPGVPFFQGIKNAGKGKKLAKVAQLVNDKPVNKLNKLYGGQVIGEGQKLDEIAKLVKMKNQEAQAQKAIELLSSGKGLEIPHNARMALYQQNPMVGNSMNKIRLIIDRAKELGLDMQFDADNLQFIHNGQRLELRDAEDVITAAQFPKWTEKRGEVIKLRDEE